MRNVPIPKHALLDYVIEIAHLKNNRALAEYLGVTQAAISKIRNGTNKVSAEMILAIYDKTKMNIEYIRELIADQERIDKMIRGAKLDGEYTGKEG